MNLTHHLTSQQRTLPMTSRCRRNQTPSEQRFCANMRCLTDELSVRRVSLNAFVWLLTDEAADRSWLMMGKTPVCPHCGAPLIR